MQIGIFVESVRAVQGQLLGEQAKLVELETLNGVIQSLGGHALPANSTLREAAWQLQSLLQTRLARGIATLANIGVEALHDASSDPIFGPSSHDAAVSSARRLLALPASSLAARADAFAAAVGAGVRAGGSHRRVLQQQPVSRASDLMQDDWPTLLVLSNPLEGAPGADRTAAYNELLRLADAGREAMEHQFRALFGPGSAVRAASEEAARSPPGSRSGERRGWDRREWGPGSWRREEGRKRDDDDGDKRQGGDDRKRRKHEDDEARENGKHGEEDSNGLDPRWWCLAVVIPSVVLAFVCVLMRSSCRRARAGAPGSQPPTGTLAEAEEGRLPPGRWAGRLPLSLEAQALEATKPPHPPPPFFCAEVRTNRAYEEDAEGEVRGGEVEAEPRARYDVSATAPDLGRSASLPFAASPPERAQGRPVSQDPLAAVHALDAGLASPGQDQGQVVALGVPLRAPSRRST